MFPSYQVPPDDIVEIAFALSELGEEASQDQISDFSGESKRKVRESIKVLQEIGIITDEENYTLGIQYDDLLQQLLPEERAAIIEEALVTYQPFIDYATYLHQGYTSSQAAQKVGSVYGVSDGYEYLQTYLERLGKYAGILSDDGDLTVDVREIPTDSTASIEKLRSALESKLEIRVYLDGILGEDIMGFLDEDTKSDLTDAYLKHINEPRDSISASGRAFEDFLRNVGDTYGNPNRDYSSGSGIIPVCNHLQGDDLVNRTHKRRVFAFAEIRNKGGAHGDDAEKLERWDISSEVSLSAALDATLLMKSIYLYADSGQLSL